MALPGVQLDMCASGHLPKSNPHLQLPPLEVSFLKAQMVKRMLM